MYRDKGTDNGSYYLGFIVWLGWMLDFSFTKVQ